MGFIKFIIIVICLYFVFKYVSAYLLKRFIEKKLNQFTGGNKSDSNTTKNKKSKKSSKINWEAETVDFEEIKDDKK